MRWLRNVALRGNLPNAESLTIAAGASLAQAWTAVGEHCGIAQTELAGHVARQFHLAVTDLATCEPKALKLVPESVARHFHVLPLREDDRTLVVATSDPTDQGVERALGLVSGRDARFAVAPPTPLAEAIDAHYTPDLPVRAGSASLDGARPAAEAATSATTRLPPHILLADDDPIIRAMARTILESSGMQVSEAGDGAAALGQLETGGYDLLVLDLHMPKLNGIEVLRRVRASATTADLPVVVVTGSDADEAEVLVLEGGADDYVRKPIDAPRYVARIKAVLRRTWANRGASSP
jgi:CheY-like chemotaxis protein